MKNLHVVTIYLLIQIHWGSTSLKPLDITRFLSLEAAFWWQDKLGYCGSVSIWDIYSEAHDSWGILIRINIWLLVNLFGKEKLFLRYRVFQKKFSFPKEKLLLKYALWLFQPYLYCMTKHCRLQFCRKKAWKARFSVIQSWMDKFFWFFVAIFIRKHGFILPKEKLLLI